MLLRLNRHRRRAALLLTLFILIFTLLQNPNLYSSHSHSITTRDIALEASLLTTTNTNFFLPLPSARSLCATHNWAPYPTRSHRRKIYDLIMVNNELDWLEIRLHTMSAHVDYFIIVESRQTFTGLSKPLSIQDNMERFAQFSDQIIYHELEDIPEKVQRTWDLEDFQRNAMFLQVLVRLQGELAVEKGDVIIVADVDEIVRPAALQILRNCEIPRRVTLRSRFYYYGFQWAHVGEEWAHPQATIFAGLGRTILPADLRNGEGGNSILAWWQKADLWNAGWHCSTCFATIEEVLNKLASFSHTGLNQEVFRSRVRIMDRVRKGLDLWDREGERYQRVEGNQDVPEILKMDRERFRYLLHRDGANAGFRDGGPEELTNE